MCTLKIACDTPYIHVYVTRLQKTDLFFKQYNYENIKTKIYRDKIINRHFKESYSLYKDLVIFKCTYLFTPDLSYIWQFYTANSGFTESIRILLSTEKTSNSYQTNSIKL